MAWSTLGVVAYVAIAVFFVFNTFIEREGREPAWDGYRAFGLVLSLLWPVLIVVTLLEVWRSKRGQSGPDPDES
jgi:hypothetical protein